jgi:hypothetical protein
LAGIPQVGNLIRVTLDESGKPHLTDMTIKNIVWFDEPGENEPIGQLLLS